MLSVYTYFTFKNIIDLPKDITKIYYYDEKILIVSKLGNIF